MTHSESFTTGMLCRSRHLCPRACHEPNDAEWIILETYLRDDATDSVVGGNDIANQ